MPFIKGFANEFQQYLARSTDCTMHAWSSRICLDHETRMSQQLLVALEVSLICFKTAICATYNTIVSDTKQGRTMESLSTSRSMASHNPLIIVICVVT